MMDTSKEYIKMCDCPEIQEHRKYDGGDWLCNPEDGHSWAIWQKVHGKSEEDIRKFMDGLLWLPRQDQIQEMMGAVAKRVHILVSRFRTFCLNTPQEGELITEYLNSMEQLWLAFMMWENHQKIWDGEKWVKSAKK